MRRLRGLNTGQFIAELAEYPRVDTVAGKLRLLRLAQHSDIIVINNDTRALLTLCVMRALSSFPRGKIISVDILLPAPTTWLARFGAFAKRQVLRHVDCFILYFHDLRGYTEHYGITPGRVHFIPFKVNAWERIDPNIQPSDDGSYVLIAGRTMRDLDTFIEAMRDLPYPGILLHQDPATMERYGTVLDLENLPSNIQPVLHDGKQESWLEIMRGARVIALPTLPETISSSGISTYLDAMALGKCVVLTEGPATRGLIQNEALIVPPANPKALRAAIQTAWERPAVRQTVAAAGWEYARKLQGERRLLTDILNFAGGLAQRRIL
jgi:glycosyltransferase involved in cell wall biosynthesis